MTNAIILILTLLISIFWMSTLLVFFLMVFTFLSLFVWFVCVEVLRPSQPSWVMSSAVSLPNHTFTGQAYSSKQLTSTVHILSLETDNCPSWISGRERMTVENISWSISTKECCRSRRGLNPWPPGLQSDGASNWATEAGVIRFWRVSSHLANFNSRNKTLTAKLLQEGIGIINFGQLFFKFYRRHYEFVSKYDTGLKSLLLQGLSEPECYGA